eukprot:CAMPEP_0117659156 /NCGR_PEP_ID=MMETSP0804-20121206/6274_1 /TAXON_ID=1074897 /ORGANISM="Tetraselmis astigmatica, Strain CCMP880" /LENGTH=138 /DNA_ID=CAMNT_0005465779 /DNA_START=631 /DNA_END=1046 /DNA_ORIENTATION=+
MALIIIFAILSSTGASENSATQIGASSSKGKLPSGRKDVLHAAAKLGPIHPCFGVCHHVSFPNKSCAEQAAALLLKFCVLCCNPRAVQLQSTPRASPNNADYATQFQGLPTILGLKLCLEVPRRGSPHKHGPWRAQRP